MLYTYTAVITESDGTFYAKVPDVLSLDSLSFSHHPLTTKALLFEYSV